MHGAHSLAPSSRERPKQLSSPAGGSRPADWRPEDTQPSRGHHRGQTGVAGGVVVMPGRVVRSGRLVDAPRTQMPARMAGIRKSQA